MSLTEKLGTGALVGGIGTAVVIFASVAGAGFGAIGGEILDHMPYLNHAIPEGIAYLGNAFSDQDTVEEATQYLQGNLDKVGAAMGFLGGYVRTTVSAKS